MDVHMTTPCGDEGRVLQAKGYQRCATGQQAAGREARTRFSFMAQMEPTLLTS